MSNSVNGEVINLIVCDDGKVSRQEGYGELGWSTGGDESVCPHQGFIRYIVCRNREGYEPYVEMRQVYVLAIHRRKGVATKLFKELEKITREEKLDTIYVQAFFAPNEENDFCRFLRKMKYLQSPPAPEKFEWVKHV